MNLFNSFLYDLNVFIVQDNKQEIQIMRRRIAIFHLVPFFASSMCWLTPNTHKNKISNIEWMMINAHIFWTDRVFWDYTIWLIWSSVIPFVDKMHHCACWQQQTIFGSAKVYIISVSYNSTKGICMNTNLNQKTDRTGLWSIMLTMLPLFDQREVV